MTANEMLERIQISVLEEKKVLPSVHIATVVSDNAFMIQSCWPLQVPLHLVKSADLELIERFRFAAAEDFQGIVPTIVL